MCHPLCNWSYRFGKRDLSEAGVYPKRMLGRMGKRSSKVLGRITKRSSNMLGRITKRQEEEVARMLVRITKRQDEEVARMLGRMSKKNEETTRVLGRMTKRGKLAKRRGGDDVEEPWLQVVHPGSQWFSRDNTDQWRNGLGRASKRATDDGRRFSRVGVWDREDITGKEKMVLRKRSGPGGRFIRIGMAEDDVDGSKEMRLLVNKRSAENDQSSRWIRIGVNDNYSDFRGIAKRAEEPEIDDQFVPGSTMPSESVDDGEEDWHAVGDEAPEDVGRGPIMMRRQWQRLTR